MCVRVMCMRVYLCMVVQPMSERLSKKDKNAFLNLIEDAR